MSEETARPDGRVQKELPLHADSSSGVELDVSARLTATQRGARGPDNGRGVKLDVSALENWRWNAACVIRGPVDAPKFKDYILPLVFRKRLSDVFDDEVRHLAAEFGSEATAAKLVEKDHKLVRFFIPEAARWPTIARQTEESIRNGKPAPDFPRTDKYQVGLTLYGNVQDPQFIPICRGGSKRTRAVFTTRDWWLMSLVAIGERIPKELRPRADRLRCEAAVARTWWEKRKGGDGIPARSRKGPTALRNDAICCKYVAKKLQNEAPFARAIAFVNASCDESNCCKVM